jgi:predicted transcriptional regulator
MPEKASLGEQQLEVLRFVSEHAPITVSEVAKRFGEPRGLARTTLLTVMETLRKKGYLTRAKMNGSYHYQPRLEQEEVLRNLVRNFVEKTLKGSLSPFVAYLGEASDITDDELDALKRRVEELDQKREGGGS